MVVPNCERTPDRRSAQGAAAPRRKRGIALLERSPGDGPLPDHLTEQQAENQAKGIRERKAASGKEGKKGKGGTVGKYKSNHDCWFVPFIEYAKWDYEDRSYFLDEAGEVTRRAEGTFQQFARYLHATPSMTFPTFKVSGSPLEQAHASRLARAASALRQERAAR